MDTGVSGATRVTAQSRQLHAGVARADITSDAVDVAVHDRLYATALVLEQGQTRVVVVGMDVVAISGIGDVGDGFLPRLRARVEGELGIPGGNILVNASHTHPPGRILCSDAEQVDRTFDAIARAFRSMVPARAGSGVGFEDRIAINRTLRMRDGGSWTIRQAYPCPADDQVASLGPVDPRIGVVRIDRADGRPLAVLFNYACHPLIGVPHARITANYPGFARTVIEQALGEGATALFLQGAGGDVTEVLYKDVNRPKDAEPIGTLLGLAALAALRGIQTADAKLGVALETVTFPRRTDFPERLHELEGEQAELVRSLRFTSLSFKSFLPLYLKYALSPEWPSDHSYRYLHEEASGRDDLAALDAENRRNIAKYLRNIQAMENLAKIQDDIATHQRHQAINAEAGGSTVQAEVLGIRIGDCVLVSCPAEALTQVGLNVKAASPYEHTFVAAFSNGYMHYGPPAGDYGKGGYEVTECFLAPEWQEIYERAARDVIRRL